MRASREAEHFLIHFPLYTLAKMLFPVITQQRTIAEDRVLLRVELEPFSKSLRGSWKEICLQSLELLRQCVYIDKDLVLPPMGSSGPEETFFVVACTDMTGVSIMMDRIRQQVGKLPKLKASGTLSVTAELISGAVGSDASTLEDQVRRVADDVSEIIQKGLWSRQSSFEKEKHENAKAN